MPYTLKHHIDFSSGTWTKEEILSKFEEVEEEKPLLPKTLKKLALDLCRKYREVNKSGYPEIWIWFAQELTTARVEERKRVCDDFLKIIDKSAHENNMVLSEEVNRLLESVSELTSQGAE